ncbi:MAG: 3-oxoacyl-ACP reductase FabG [Rubrivivax sp.]|nr:3-oxoacyl-ACP reductase FabG [Pyrinomonadaceae bacterium]
MRETKLVESGTLTKLPNSLRLHGRVALVTGGSRGIGRSVVEKLAESGVDVAVNYLSDDASAEEAVGSAAKYGVRVMSVRGDVSKLSEARVVVSSIMECFGRIDFLICNAGLWEGASVDTHSEALWQRIIDTNLKGSWTICREAVPHMKKQGFGRIVLISSTAGQRGEANYSSYAASKGGQIAFTKSLAAELAVEGINVNAVAPGWVETEMTAPMLSDSDARRRIETSIPLGRVATADEVAWPVVFLCSEWARHVTGEVLNVNGGSVLCG